MREYIDWYANAPKVGYLIIRKSLLSAMLDKFTEDHIRHLAKITAKQSREINMLFASEYTLSSALKVIEYKMRMSGYVYRKEIRDDFHIYIIEDDMGPKWSLYLAELDNVLAFKVRV